MQDHPFHQVINKISKVFKAIKLPDEDLNKAMGIE
jgi:hypothetical protein